MTKLQEALKEVQNTHIKEVDEMNTQLERQRERTEELTEAVSQHLYALGLYQQLRMARSLVLKYKINVT